MAFVRGRRARGRRREPERGASRAATESIRRFDVDQQRESIRARLPGARAALPRPARAPPWSTGGSAHSDESRPRCKPRSTPSQAAPRPLARRPRPTTRPRAAGKDALRAGTAPRFAAPPTAPGRRSRRPPSPTAPCRLAPRVASSPFRRARIGAMLSRWFRRRAPQQTQVVRRRTPTPSPPQY